MDEIKVSVIVPVYNSEKYLAGCIDSIVGQTYKNLEIIIVDDGSRDNSWKIISEYADKNDRIVAIHQSNMGASRARNHGMKYATGEAVTFFDSDDLMKKNYLSSMVSLYKRYNADLVVGSFEWMNEDGTIKSAYLNSGEVVELNKEQHKENFRIVPSVCCKLFRRSIIEKNKIRFVSVGIGQDWNFYLKYKLYANCTVVTNERLVQYREVDNSISHSYDLRILDLVKNHKNVVAFYKKKNKYEEYKKMLNTTLMHQMGEQFKKLPRMKTKEDGMTVWRRYRRYFFQQVHGFGDVYLKIYCIKAMAFFMIPPIDDGALSYKILNLRLNSRFCS